MEMRRTLLTLSAATLLVAVLWVFSRVSAEPSRSGLLGSCPQVPTSVRPVLERACLDCHSNETKWPWYNRVPLVSWLIQRDVNKGREHLNFSTWAGDSPRLVTSNEIQEICDAVSEGVMPPGRYRLMHPEARLSEADKETFCTWADQMRGAASQSVGIKSSSGEAGKAGDPP